MEKNNWNTAGNNRKTIEKNRNTTGILLERQRNRTLNEEVFKWNTNGKAAEENSEQGASKMERSMMELKMRAEQKVLKTLNKTLNFS